MSSEDREQQHLNSNSHPLTIYSDSLRRGVESKRTGWGEITSQGITFGEGAVMDEMAYDFRMKSVIVHRCGQYLRFEVLTGGGSATYQPDILGADRFTFTSHSRPSVAFSIGHGTQVDRCPRCRQVLPTEIEQWKNEDFRPGGFKVEMIEPEGDEGIKIG